MRIFYGNVIRVTPLDNSYETGGATALVTNLSGVSWWLLNK